MAKTLVIVESPAKSKTIMKYLGRNYSVEASVGHIRDLPKSTFGIDLENNFTPKYITIRGKADVANKLKKEAKKADKVLLATDPDREGEAISWHLSKILGIDESKACRVSFNEITKDAVQKAIKEPRPIDMDLVDSQQARRILDRIVGYKISPLLWRNIKKGLSAGRVQSVATKIICDREEEIENFVPVEYWNIIANLSKKDKDAVIETKFYGSKAGKKMSLDNEEQVNKILSDIKDKEFIVQEVRESKKRRNPAPPFITSTLQQEASRKLGYSTKKTMMVAQQLYEGVNVKGHGSMGLITYMRTDSVRISEEAITEVRKHITEKYGNDYLNKTPRQYSKKTSSQDAHEAIRPTYFNLSPTEVRESITRDQYRLYKLIWERFVACQMSSAIIDAVSADIVIDDYMFRATGSKINFPGYMKVYQEGKDNSDKDDDDKFLPPLDKGEELLNKGIEPKQLFTTPPPRFTEASLVKYLEEQGIGRPSTYAPTISTIITRGYIEREKKNLLPTELGKIVNDLMKVHFSNIVDLKFTANMESMLDSIEVGEAKWVEEIAKFYEGFEKVLEKADANIEKIEIKEEVSDVQCEKCGRMMVIRSGRFGKFLACPGFPECRNTKNIVEEAGVPCPLCSKPIIYRKTKRMKKYLACSGYPDCEFMSWDLPAEGKNCSECGSFMVKRSTRAMGEHEKCSNPNCITNEDDKPKESAGNKEKAKATADKKKTTKSTTKKAASKTAGKKTDNK